MAAKIHGRLGFANLVGLTYGNLAPTLIYTVPAGRKATVTLSLCNLSASPITSQSVLLQTGSALVSGCAIEFNPTVAVGIPLERAGITMNAGESIAINQTSSTTGPSMAVVVWGIEEDI